MGDSFGTIRIIFFFLPIILQIACNTYAKNAQNAKQKYPKKISRVFNKKYCTPIVSQFPLNNYFRYGVFVKPCSTGFSVRNIYWSLADFNILSILFTRILPMIRLPLTRLYFKYFFWAAYKKCTYYIIF